MNDLLNRFLSMAPNPVVLTDGTGTILAVNEAFARASGYSVDELIGDNVNLLKSHQTPRETHQNLWETILAGNTWTGSFVNRRKNGSLYRVRATIGPVNCPELPEQECFMGIFEDVTEQDRIKHVLSLQANLLRELSERIPGLIFQLQKMPDDHYCMPYASAPLVRFFGCKPEDVIDNINPIFGALHPEDAPFFRSSLELSAADLSEWEQDFRVCLPDGKVRWYSGRASPEALEDHSVLWHGYISDITRLKQTESELENKAELLRNQNFILQRAQYEAGQADRIKSQFLANISHEIRTPMNGIVGASSLLAETSLSPDQEEYLQILQSSSETMMQVINSILDFSKLESKNLSVEESTFDLAQFFDEVAERLRASAETKGLRFSAETDDRARMEVRGDPHHLRQILLNIGQNAIKFTSIGTISLSLQLFSESNSRKIFRFRIADTGIGIPTDKVDQIFEPFAQADDSNTRAYGGTGLGLAIARMLAESMNGTIAVQSEVDQGSVFTVDLPLKGVRASRPRPRPASPPGKQPVASTNASSPSILLVEDDASNRSVVERIVKRIQCRITTAINGVDALERVKEQAFDLILMDCQMPMMDGFQATRRIRKGESGQCPSDVPILALTALALDGDQERCLEAGMDAYISKPVNREQLQETILQFLST